MAKTWVLLRGLIRESRHWEGFPDAFRQHFPGDQVVTIDLPGNGAKFQERSPLHIDDMVACLRDELSKQGLQPPFHVVALSLGAMTAISWLNDYPNEVSAAVLINTSVARFSAFWQRLRPENYGVILQTLLTSDRLRREKNILDISTNLISEQKKEEVSQRWAGYAASHGVTRANSIRQVIAAARFKAPKVLSSRVPVLVLNGGGDRLVHPDCSSIIAEKWNLPIQIHPTAGHDLTMDDGPWALDKIFGWVSP
ncbi:MAG: alpha/beta hydrolase [Alcanivoracaceae bacterium]|nr:alpha/beta hydrolase [Alcanivoracaceae bacterium]